MSEAARIGDVDSVNNMLPHDIGLRTSDGRGYSVLHIACEYGRVNVVKFIIENAPKYGNMLTFDDQTPLHVALENGQEDVAMTLLETNVDVRRVDHRGNTVLHLASDMGLLNAVAYLLRKGININTRDSAGRTPIVRAMERGHTDVARYLMHRNATMTEYERLFLQSLPTRSHYNSEAEQTRATHERALMYQLLIHQHTTRGQQYLPISQGPMVIEGSFAESNVSYRILSDSLTSVGSLTQRQSEQNLPPVTQELSSISFPLPVDCSFPQMQRFRERRLHPQQISNTRSSYPLRTSIVNGATYDPQTFSQTPVTANHPFYISQPYTGNPLPYPEASRRNCPPLCRPWSPSGNRELHSASLQGSGAFRPYIPRTISSALRPSFLTLPAVLEHNPPEESKPHDFLQAAASVASAFENKMGQEPNPTEKNSGLLLQVCNQLKLEPDEPRNVIKEEPLGELEEPCDPTTRDSGAGQEQRESFSPRPASVKSEPKSPAQENAETPEPHNENNEASSNDVDFNIKPCSSGEVLRSQEENARQAVAEFMAELYCNSCDGWPELQPSPQPDRNSTQATPASTDSNTEVDKPPYCIG